MNPTPETRKDRDSEVVFRGQKRSNETHQSASAPQARLYRKGKGKPVQLCFMGHALMKNRSGTYPCRFFSDRLPSPAP